MLIKNNSQFKFKVQKSKFEVWMKPKRIFLPILAVSFVISTAFNKPVIRPSDYRDAYVGTYFCSSVCQGVNSEHTGLTTATDTITISVAKDPMDSILQITIDSAIFQVKLTSTTMTAYPLGQHWAGLFYSTDSIGFAKSVGIAANGCRYKGKKN